jgi:hypothetical protein
MGLTAKTRRFLTGHMGSGAQPGRGIIWRSRNGLWQEFTGRLDSTDETIGESLVRKATAYVPSLQTLTEFRAAENKER